MSDYTQFVNEDKISKEDKLLIDEFIKTKGITILPPGAMTSAESIRATNEIISQKRKDFRAIQRKKHAAYEAQFSIDSPI